MQRTSEGTALQVAECRLHALFVQGMDGDAAAYRAFLSATATQLRGFLRRRLRQWPDEVEDLVQEALLAIHNQRASYDTEVPLTAWVHAIARYKLIDWLRRHARRDALHETLDEADAMVDGGEQEAGEARRDLAALLASLPARQREAIVLTKLDGLSVREAAAALSISESALKVCVHRGLKALAANLREKE